MPYPTKTTDVFGYGNTALKNCVWPPIRSKKARRYFATPETGETLEFCFRWEPVGSFKCKAGFVSCGLKCLIRFNPTDAVSCFCV